MGNRVENGWIVLPNMRILARDVSSYTVDTGEPQGVEVVLHGGSRVFAKGVSLEQFDELLNEAFAMPTPYRPEYTEAVTNHG